MELKKYQLEEVNEELNSTIEELNAKTHELENYKAFKEEEFKKLSIDLDIEKKMKHSVNLT